MHDDLLEQAEQLAQIDSRRPKQANLRRAVSSIFYAAFHFLVEESCCVIMGRQHAQQGYRFVLARAFTHTTMNWPVKALPVGH